MDYLIMKMKLLCCSIALILTGCKTELTTDVDYSQLTNKEHKVVAASLMVEVPACTDYQDSRKESKTLTDLRKTIANVLPSSEYKECFRKGMDSYASFTTPVSIGYMGGNMSLDLGTIYLGGNEGTPMFAYIPPPLKKAINGAKKDSMMDKSLSFSIVVNLKNDTDKEVKISPTAVFVNDYPIVTMQGSSIPIKKGYQAKIKLSDVSIASMLDENVSGTTPILLAPTLQE